MNSLSLICPEARIRLFVSCLIGAGCVAGSMQATEDIQLQFVQERTTHLAETKVLRERDSTGDVPILNMQSEASLRSRIERGQALAAQLAQEKPRMIAVIDVPGDASPDLERVLMQRTMRRNQWRLFQYEIRNLSPDAASAATAEWLRRQEPELGELRALQQVVVEESGQNAVVQRSNPPPESAAPGVKTFSQARDAFLVELRKEPVTKAPGDPGGGTTDQSSQSKALEELMKTLAEQAAHDSEPLR